MNQHELLLTFFFFFSPSTSSSSSVSSVSPSVPLPSLPSSPLPCVEKQAKSRVQLSRTRVQVAPKDNTHPNFCLNFLVQGHVKNIAISTHEEAPLLLGLNSGTKRCLLYTGGHGTKSVKLLVFHARHVGFRPFEPKGHFCTVKMDIFSNGEEKKGMNWAFPAQGKYFC